MMLPIHEPSPRLVTESKPLGALGRNGISIDVSALIRKQSNLFRDLLRKFRWTNAHDHRTQLAQPAERSSIQ